MDNSFNNLTDYSAFDAKKPSGVEPGTENENGVQDVLPASNVCGGDTAEVSAPAAPDSVRPALSAAPVFPDESDAPFMPQDGWDSPFFSQGAITGSDDFGTSLFFTLLTLFSAIGLVSLIFTMLI